MPANASDWSEPFLFTVGNVSVDKKTNENSPLTYGLSQNYPNPFNPITTINYSIAKNSAVKITVFDLLGRKVSVLENSHKSAGYHNVIFNASDLASGVYIYRIDSVPADGSPGFTDNKKLILIK